MTRPALSGVPRATAIGIFALTCAAAAQTQIHPPAGAGGPIVIAVLADHFTAAEEIDFDIAAENLFKYSLFVNGYYASRADAFLVQTIFEPWASTPGSPSKYGFEVGTGTTNCDVSWIDNATAAAQSVKSTAQRLEEASGAIAPTRIVVIGNYGQNFGCTDGAWSYVSSGTVGMDVLPHEFGHVLAGLFDEYALGHLLSTTYPDAVDELEKLNCSTIAAPHWLHAPLNVPPPPVLACDLHGLGVTHPTDDCLMGTSGHDFCHVCKARMGRFIDEQLNLNLLNPDLLDPEVPTPDVQNPDVENPNPKPRPPPPAMQISHAAFVMQPAAQPPKPVPPTPKPLPPAPTPVPAPTPKPVPPTPQPEPATVKPPPPPGPVLRLLITVDSEGKSATIRQVTNATGRYVPAYRKTGTLVWEVSDGTTVVEVGVVPRQQFRSRSYQGGTQRHGSSDAPATDVVVSVPGLTIEAARSRNLRLAFYELNPGVSARLITPAVLTALRNSKQAEERASVSPDEIKKLLPTP